MSSHLSSPYPSSHVLFPPTSPYEKFPEHGCHSYLYKTAWAGHQGKGEGPAPLQTGHSQQVSGLFSKARRSQVFCTHPVPLLSLVPGSELSPRSVSLGAITAPCHGSHKAPPVGQSHVAEWEPRLEDGDTGSGLMARPSRWLVY